jgi:uncharacterized protein YjbJ (UPF0337 family)
MNEDRLEGAATNFGGSVEEGFGNITGDTKMQVEGLIDQAKGKAQNLYGSAKDAVDAALDSAPPVVRDGAERAFGAVKAHPLLTALFAGAVGYAVALSLNSGANGDANLRRQY